jgi:2-keto-3-deoxy-L-fuconate dehydrogenase
MTDRLKDKIAFVTAAGQGIGRATCEAFIAEGARVIATDLDAGKLDGLACARRERLDVRSSAEVDRLAAAVTAEFGPPDILVNCAGFVHHGTALDCSEADWDFSFDVNVKSIHRTLRAFLPAMRQSRRGAIVSISSAVSSITAVPNRYVYGATKAAIIGLTKAVAMDFIREGIRANAVCPGTIETPSLAGRVADLSRATGKTVESVHKDFIERQPMGRLGTAAEVAALVVFLASDEASFITGHAYLVDGGMAV